MLISIQPFVRRVDDHRNRVSNPLLERATDLVVQAVNYLELEEDRNAHQRRADDDKVYAKRAERAAKGLT